MTKAPEFDPLGRLGRLGRTQGLGWVELRVSSGSNSGLWVGSNSGSQVGRTQGLGGGKNGRKPLSARCLRGARQNAYDDIGTMMIRNEDLGTKNKGMWRAAPAGLRFALF